MKTSRLLVYAAGGIIAGLLLENKALSARQDASKAAKKMKKKANKLAERLHGK